MHTKSFYPSPTGSHERSNQTTLPKTAPTSEASALTVMALSARHSTLRDRQASLVSMTDGLGARTQRNLTVAFVDQCLLETTRLAAEVLELAERADEVAHRSRKRGGQGMRALADVCFD